MQNYNRNYRQNNLGDAPVVKLPVGIFTGSKVSGSMSQTDLLVEMANSLRILGSEFALERGLISKTFAINTVPVLIADGQVIKSLYTLNPSSVPTSTAIGSAKSGQFMASQTVIANGNTQLAPFNVTDYRDLHLYFKVTAVAGVGPNMNVIAQAYDINTNAWYDTQMILSGVTSPGNYYISTGSVGLATTFAIRWELTGVGPSFTFEVGYTLKDSLPGLNSSVDVSRTIYIGSSEVTTVSGFPLFEKQSRIFWLKDNVKLYAVSKIALSLKMFIL